MYSEVHGKRREPFFVLKTRSFRGVGWCFATPPCMKFLLNLRHRPHLQANLANDRSEPLGKSAEIAYF
jgi:hypothetical protein